MGRLTGKDKYPVKVERKYIHTQIWYQNQQLWDIAGGPVAKNLLSSAGDMVLIPGQETKVPHAMGQLSPCAAATKLVCSGAHALQPEKTFVPQVEGKSVHCNEEPAEPSKQKKSKRTAIMRSVQMQDIWNAFEIKRPAM